MKRHLVVGLMVWLVLAATVGFGQAVEGQPNDPKKELAEKEKQIQLEKLQKDLAQAKKDADKHVTALQSKLARAQAWSVYVTAIQRTERLIVPVEYLGTPLQAIQKAGDDAAFEDLELLLDTVNEPQKSQALLDPSRAKKTWISVRKQFWSALEQKKRSPEAILAWIKLLDAWEQAVDGDDTRFRDAAQQLVPVLQGLLLDYQSDHIEAALTREPWGKPATLQQRSRQAPTPPPAPPAASAPAK